MHRNTRETTPDNTPDELLALEEDLLDLTRNKKKWYQFKSVGKYFSDLVALLPDSVSQFISDAWQKPSQFFSSKSSYPRLRDFIVHGSIALIIMAAIITTSILTMGLGPLIMAGGPVAAAGIIGAIVVVGITVSAIWGGIGAAYQGFMRYLEENWSNVPEAKCPLPIEEPIAPTYTQVASNLPAPVTAPVTAPIPVPVSNGRQGQPSTETSIEDSLKQRVWQPPHRALSGSSTKPEDRLNNGTYPRNTV